jgi:hypothetical protein
MALADFRNAIITQDKFSQTFNKFDRSVAASGRGLDKLGGVISGGGLGMLFGATAGVAGALAIGKMAWSLGELGAQSLTTKTSFESLMRSVGQSTQLLDQLKSAAGGTVTEMKLMQLTNTALAGSTGALSTEMAGALPKLLEAGRAAALLNPSLGDAEFMFQSLITGIKRGSPMLIDNTGITLKLGEATEAYAASLGKSSEELTSQERSIAILRATLTGADTLIQQAGGNLNSMTSDIQSATVAVEELKTAFGELAAPAVAGIAGPFADVLDSARITLFGSEIEKARDKVDTLWASQQKITDSDLPQWLKDAYMAAERFTSGGVGPALVALQAMQAPIQNVRRLTSEYGSAATIAAANIGTLTFSLRQAKEAAMGLGGSMGGLPADYKAGLNSAFGQVYGQGSAIPAGEADAMYSGYARQYAQLELDKTTISRQEYTRRKADLDTALSDQIGSYRKFSSDVGGIATDMSDDLKSKIGSALRPTFDLSGLTGGALGGVGGDAFDEAYKRLAAVALRPEELQTHAGDWASTFEQAGLTGLTPEEAQARAKELVEAYSKGLDFSLIDREAIKDSVRQAIRAEELYNTIVDEIYAEMGKEKPKLAQAGASVGNQLNRAMTATVTSGASAYLGAWLDVLEPGMIARLDARYRRTGQAQ